MNNLMITIELTGRCNLRCIHCLRDKTGKLTDMPYSLFTKIIKQAKKYNRPHIALTGGEPTIHKDFFKALKFLSHHGLNYHFVTNGYNFAKIYTRLTPFLKRGLTRISFSLDGATEKTHDRIRGKGSYRKALEAIAICKARKMPITVQMVVNRLNRHEIEPMAHLASKMDFEKIYFSHMQPAFSNLTYNISLPPEEWFGVEEKINELKSIYTVPIYMSGGFFDETPLSHCIFLQGSALNINYQGQLTFCCQLSNVFDSSAKKDIICDLNRTSLFRGHKLLTDKIASFNKRRIEAIEKGTLTKLDSFHCWFCAKELSKVDWMKHLKDNPWTRRDPYFKRRSKKRWRRREAHA